MALALVGPFERSALRILCLYANRFGHLHSCVRRTNVYRLLVGMIRVSPMLGRWAVSGIGTRSIGCRALGERSTGTSLKWARQPIKQRTAQLSECDDNNCQQTIFNDVDAIFALSIEAFTSPGRRAATFSVIVSIPLLPLKCCCTFCSVSTLASRTGCSFAF